MKPAIRPRKTAYDEVADLVESAVAYGWTRAHKYTASPTPEQVQKTITVAVLTHLAESCAIAWSRRST